jgi:hypothetical protein
VGRILSCGFSQLIHDDDDCDDDGYDDDVDEVITLQT